MSLFFTVETRRRHAMITPTGFVQPLRGRRRLFELSQGALASLATLG